MPLYEYECAACGERTEVIRAYSDPPLTVCSVCGGALKKLLSSPAFQFKGAGWYATDYGKGGKTGENEKSTSKGEEGKGPSESKSDSAGESKKEDSSKGKSDGASDAAPASPATSTSPAPSKKKSGDPK